MAGLIGILISVNDRRLPCKDCAVEGLVCAVRRLLGPRRAALPSPGRCRSASHAAVRNRRSRRPEKMRKSWRSSSCGCRRSSAHLGGSGRVGAVAASPPFARHGTRRQALNRRRRSDLSGGRAVRADDAGLESLQTTMRPGDDALSLEIVGSQWWWRVRYAPLGQEPVELANEIRLPVAAASNARVDEPRRHPLVLGAVHRREDRHDSRPHQPRPLEPTRVGTYRGACAEFCGTSHARMNLMPCRHGNADFERWLADAGAPAAMARCARSGQRGAGRVSRARLQHVPHHPRDDARRRRRSRPDARRRPRDDRRGTAADAARQLSPLDLQHRVLKPGAHMPAFDALPDDTLHSLATYLAQLQ